MNDIFNDMENAMTEETKMTKQEFCNKFNNVNNLNAVLRWDTDASEKFTQSAWLRIKGANFFVNFEVDEQYKITSYSDIGIDFRRTKNVEDVLNIIKALEFKDKAEEIYSELGKLKLDKENLILKNNSLEDTLEEMRSQNSVINFAQDTILKAIKGGNNEQGL